MALVIFNNYKEQAALGNVDLIADTIKVALETNTWVPNIDTDQFWSDISANEVTGTNWAAGGIALGSKTVTQDDTNDKMVFDAADLDEANVTVANARYYVIYQDTGTPTTSVLIGYESFGADQSVTGAQFKITWDAAGIFENA